MTELGLRRRCREIERDLEEAELAVEDAVHQVSEAYLEIQDLMSNPPGRNMLSALRAARGRYADAKRELDSAHQYKEELASVLLLCLSDFDRLYGRDA
jgi:predicted S18 family serine protease